jgi:hypothetical protein
MRVSLGLNGDDFGALWHQNLLVLFLGKWVFVDDVHLTFSFRALLCSVSASAISPGVFGIAFFAGYNPPPEVESALPNFGIGFAAQYAPQVFIEFFHG